MENHQKVFFGGEKKAFRRDMITFDWVDICRYMICIVI